MSDPAPQTFLYLFPTVVEAGPGMLSLQWADAEGAFAKRALPAGNASLGTLHGRSGALSPEDCRRVVALGESLPRTDGRVEIGADAYRVSHIAWIEPKPDHQWLYDKVAALFALANRHYGFELTGFVDALQYTVYGPEQHFDWHLDLGMDQTSARKLSMTIQLSEPRDYTGGELEFITLKLGEQARLQGSATFFPSYLAHRVSPVLSGVRRSLVAWGYGPAFR